LPLNPVYPLVILWTESHAKENCSKIPEVTNQSFSTYCKCFPINRLLKVSDNLGTPAICFLKIKTGQAILIKVCLCLLAWKRILNVSNFLKFIFLMKKNNNVLWAMKGKLEDPLLTYVLDEMGLKESNKTISLDY